MSQNFKRAGKITGSPLCGLCDRVCIQTKRVLDGCVYRRSNVELNITLSSVSPSLTPPYTFSSVRSVGISVVQNLILTTLPDGKTRVQTTIAVPVTVTFTDESGQTGTGQGEVTFNRDVVLSIPRQSLLPYEIEPSTVIEGSIGAFVGGGVGVVASACVLQIIRATATVEILVPSYGYCEYPDCEEYGDRACRTLFARPIFPT